MPRSRGSEMAQRVSTRGPAPLRTSSSDSDPLHHRPITDRSPKLGDRRSPRNAQSEPVNQKKLGTRIAGLESQLEQAQGELKILKDQLASAEAAKKEAQKELEKKITKPSGSDSNNETGQENENETDVFEVPIEIVNPEPKINVTIMPESPEKPSFEETLAAKNEELTSLKLKLDEKEANLKAFDQENATLKRQLNESNSEASSVKANEQKTNLKLTQLEAQFENSENEKSQLTEKLKEAEGAKQALESEMKKLRVQTEQWRKAADAAAAVLSGAPEGRRGSDRMHYGGVYEGYGGFVGSPGQDDESDDGLGTGKRKGSGIRMFGDLWKKKGQK